MTEAQSKQVLEEVFKRAYSKLVDTFASPRDMSNLEKIFQDNQFVDNPSDLTIDLLRSLIRFKEKVLANGNMDKEDLLACKVLLTEVVVSTDILRMQLKGEWTEVSWDDKITAELYGNPDLISEEFFHGLLFLGSILLIVQETLED